jgi:hypothetical protein
VRPLSTSLRFCGAHEDEEFGGEFTRGLGFDIEIFT